MKFDYNFHLIKRQDEDGPVKMRIDFTNEEGYWNEVTNASVTRKRSVDDQVPFHEWKERIVRARSRSSERTDYSSTGLAVHTHDRRWYGAFVDWLKKVTTIESKQVGVLPSKFIKGSFNNATAMSCTNTKLKTDLLTSYFF